MQNRGFVLSVLLLFVLTGCGGSNGEFVVQGRETLPLAVNDTYQGLGNAVLRVTAEEGLLSNDQLNGGALAGFEAITARGGRVKVEADGSFAYTPPDNLTNVVDTFDYSLLAQTGKSEARVTITLAQLARFVDNTAPIGGDGTRSNPLNTIQGAIDASVSGDSVFVLATVKDYNENITLAGGVEVRGEGAGFTIDNALARGIRPSVVQPAGEFPRLSGSVGLVSDSTLGGFEVSGMIAGNGISNIKLFQNRVRDVTVAVTLNEVSGTLFFQGNEFRGIGGNAVSLTNTGVSTTTSFRAENNSFEVEPGESPGQCFFLSSLGGVLEGEITGNIATGGASSGSYQGFLFSTVVGDGSKGSRLVVKDNITETSSSFAVSTFDRGGRMEFKGNMCSGNPTLSATITDSTGQPASLDIGGLNPGEANVLVSTIGAGPVLTPVLAASDAATTVCRVAGNILDIPGNALDASLSNGQLIIQKNRQIDGSGSYSFSVGDGLLRLSDNDWDGADLVVGTTGLVCAVIGGNFASQIELVEGVSSTLRVEGLEASDGGPLSNLNNGAVVFSSQGVPESIPVGFCEQQGP
jgi:Bacterial Ig domain